MERGFLSPKDKRGERGVKEKKGGSAAGSGFVFVSDPKLGNDTRSLRTYGNKDGAIPSVTVASGNTQEKNVGKSSTGSTPSLYANVASKPNRKKVNFCTLFSPAGNRINVVVLVESIRAISDRFANTAYDFFFGKQMVRGLFEKVHYSEKWHPDVNLLKEDLGTVPVWVKFNGVPVTAFSKDSLSAIATKLAMIELRADVELKDNIVMAMPKITGEGYYTCNIRIEYEWKPPKCACCKVFGHVQKECPKNIGVGEIKNLKKPSQTPKGIKVDQKMGFNHTKQVFQPVSKKLTSNGGNKKKYMEPTKEVVYSGDSDCEDEVASVDNEMASFLAKKNGYVNTARPKAVNTARPHSAVVNAVRVNQENVVKASACWGKLQQDDTGFIDSGCSRHMTGNIAYLLDFKEFDRGYVTFRGGAHGGRIYGKGTLKTDSLDFEDVYFVNELNFKLFSVSQMCDKKVLCLFIDSDCLVLSPNLKLPDESQILLKIPRKDNMYSFDMKNIVPKESLTCLVAKATSDESMLWHRRLGHINFKNS
ncbi:ribonuclease H-like domain-containing protein [Tanacetum coccineum]